MHASCEVPLYLQHGKIKNNEQVQKLTNTILVIGKEILKVFI